MKNRISTIIFALAVLFAAPAAIAQKPTAPKIPIPSGDDIRGGAPAAGDAPKIQIGKAETFKLDNGLTCIVVENHKLPRVSYQIFVDYGAIQEKDAAGYVQMMGDLLAKGTTSRDKSAIDASIDFIGASMFSSSNGVNGNCLTKHSESLLEIMSDVLLNPTFPQEELDKAKVQAQSGLAANRDDANAIAGNVNPVLTYGKDHPYGEVMTEETLEKINLDHIKNHYNTYFSPNISYFVVVGDITPKQAKAYANKYFGNWKEKDVPVHKYQMPSAPKATQVDFVNKAGAVQSVINICYPVDMKPGSADAIPARLMNTILGGYFNSRLNANLREGRAFTYGARSSLSSDKLVGGFNAYASVRNEVTDSSVVEFLNEMNKLRNEPMPEDELQLVKNVLTGQFSRNLEQPGTVAGFALSTARYKLPADYYEKYLTVLNNVTAKQIQEMAQKYVRPDQAHILVVGSKDEVADKLAPFAADGKVNFYDIYGNPDKSNELAIPEGVDATTVVKDYIKAIGGNDKIGEIGDMSFEATMSMGSFGQLSLSHASKGNSKLYTKIVMNGQTMSEQKFDGEKGVQGGMGQPMGAMAAEQITDAKEQAKFCREQDYLTRGYRISLTGIEVINKKNAYVLEVERMADGKKTTEYYDMETSLKVRDLTVQSGPDGSTATLTNDYSDYQPLENGVLMPRKMVITGAAPVPMEVTIDKIEINKKLEDSIFEVK